MFYFSDDSKRPDHQEYEVISFVHVLVSQSIVHPFSLIQLSIVTSPCVHQFDSHSPIHINHQSSVSILPTHSPWIFHSLFCTINVDLSITNSFIHMYKYLSIHAYIHPSINSDTDIIIWHKSFITSYTVSLIRSATHPSTICLFILLGFSVPLNCMFGHQTNTHAVLNVQWFRDSFSNCPCIIIRSMQIYQSVMISMPHLVCSQTCPLVCGIYAQVSVFVLSFHISCLFEIACLVCLMGTDTVNPLCGVFIGECLVVVKSKLELCLSRRDEDTYCICICLTISQWPVKASRHLPWAVQLCSNGFFRECEKRWRDKQWVEAENCYVITVQQILIVVSDGFICDISYLCSRGNHSNIS